MNDQAPITAEPKDCDHVFDERWYPLDRRQVRRVCVLPGCHHVQVQAATA